MKSRKSTKRVLAVAVLAAIGVAGTMGAASAATVIAPGSYNMVINVTPSTTYTVPGSSTVYSTYLWGSTNSGTDGTGAWNSSFTFGGAAPSSSSQAMTDNGLTAFGYGSGIAGDGEAGDIGITVAGSGGTGTTFTVTGGTPGVSGMSGTVNGTTDGAMTFNPTGRLGAIDGAANMVNLPWNIAPGNAAYQTFSTASATANAVNGTTGALTPTTIYGTYFTPISGTSNYTGTLVSGGQVGSAWGSFSGVGYFEVWNVNLILKAPATVHSGFNVDTIPGTAGGDFAQYVAPVPIPAAAWLFGSGLLGLVGIARRKKSS